VALGGLNGRVSIPGWDRIFLFPLKQKLAPGHIDKLPNKQTNKQTKLLVDFSCASVDGDNMELL
jgi:hypothetical protein